MSLSRYDFPRLLFVICIASLVLSAGSSVSPSTRIPTIAIVNSIAALQPIVGQFKDAMKDIGFTEGKTVVYLDSGTIAADALDQEIQKLSAQNPDVYVTVGSVVTVRVKDVLQKTNPQSLCPSPTPRHWAWFRTS